MRREGRTLCAAGRGPSSDFVPKSRRRRHFLTPEEGFVPVPRRSRRAARSPRTFVRAWGGRHQCAREGRGAGTETRFFHWRRRPPARRALPRRGMLERPTPGACGAEGSGGGRTGGAGRIPRRTVGGGLMPQQAKSFSFAVCFIPKPRPRRSPPAGERPDAAGAAPRSRGDEAARASGRTRGPRPPLRREARRNVPGSRSRTPAARPEGSSAPSAPPGVRRLRSTGFPRELPARPHQYGFIPAGRHSGRARPRTVCEARLRGDGAGASAGTRNIRGVHAPGSSRASTPRRSDSAAASPHEEARPRSIRIRRVPFEQPLPLKDLKEPSRTCGAPSGRARRSPDRGEDK